MAIIPCSVTPERSTHATEPTRAAKKLCAVAEIIHTSFTHHSHINDLIINGDIHGHSSGKNGVNRLNGDFAAKEERLSKKLLSDRFDYICFHSPTSKLVAKSFARLVYNDYVALPDHEAFKDLDLSLGSIDYKESSGDRRIKKAFMDLSAEIFARRVKPGMTCPNLCGNMYTASLYSALVSMISNLSPAELLGKSVGMFSYGSDLASTFLLRQSRRRHIGNALGFEHSAEIGRPPGSRSRVIRGGQSCR